MNRISLDPGEACGWATWDDDGQLVDAGTAPLWQVIDAIAWVGGQGEPGAIKPDKYLHDAFLGWDELIVEDWALYPWKLDAMAWDTCRTARGIGALELIARLTGREIHLQPAKIKESAEAAGAEELFLSPLDENRHANDAIRHGVYYFARQAPGYVIQVVNDSGKDES